MLQEQAIEEHIDPTRDEIRSWITANWDPALTLGEWWDRLARSGWAAPWWPTEWYGRDAPRNTVTVVLDECIQAGAPGPPWGVGYDLAGPILIQMGTEEQRERHVFRLASGQEAWCQLFSEPAAGSDLASVRTKAVRDGDEWIITGQKVWTTLAHHADYGMLLARTDVHVPKHAGITWFIFKMDQPGVEVRPLRQMNGKAEFNEVFISEARATDADIVGGVNRGWGVAKATMALARAYAAARTSTTAEVGHKAGFLDRPARDFPARARKTKTAKPSKGSRLIPLAAEWHRSSDPIVRQDLARLYTMNQIGRFTALRVKAEAQSANKPTASGRKILALEAARLASDLGGRILGPYGMLAGADAPAGGMVEDLILTTPSIGIAGGTNEIVKNVIAERVLGLTKEPETDTNVPFGQLPGNL